MYARARPGAVSGPRPKARHVPGRCICRAGSAPPCERSEQRSVERSDLHLALSGRSLAVGRLAPNPGGWQGKRTRALSRSAATSIAFVLRAAASNGPASSPPGLDCKGPGPGANPTRRATENARKALPRARSPRGPPDRESRMTTGNNPGPGRANGWEAGGTTHALPARPPQEAREADEPQENKPGGRARRRGGRGTSQHGPQTTPRPPIVSLDLERTPQG